MNCMSINLVFILLKCDHFRLPIVGIAMCAGLGTILGCGAVMIIGVLYGVIFIGKK